MQKRLFPWMQTGGGSYRGATALGVEDRSFRDFQAIPSLTRVWIPGLKARDPGHTANETIPNYWFLDAASDYLITKTG